MAKDRQPPFTVVQTGPNVVTVRTDIVPPYDKWERWFLLSADRHHDNKHSRWDLEKQHLEEAVERRAGVIDVGDLFCAMQGKYDKRSDRSDCRPEHQSGDYFDALVRTAADFYEPYARNWVVMGHGNHETGVLERHETNLTQRLAAILGDRTGATICHSGYSGWVRFMFSRQTERHSRRLWYHHGYGGGGPVTLDTIQAQRQRSYVENADIMVTGHTHDSWAIDTVKVRLTEAGEVEQRALWQVKCPTYKDEYRQGREGWHVRTGKPPKPLGAYWLKFTYDGNGHRIVTEVLRAS